MGADRAMLNSILANAVRPLIAVSGGVDSLTLAALCHVLNTEMTAVHAISPAVPNAATARVKALALEKGWSLNCCDAGEFSDEDYLRNPLNRCFYCKTNLYKSLAKIGRGNALMSGTNLDDLGDFRPGLNAATNYAVQHPFVQAGYAKSDVRQLALSLGLTDISELPSAPCLSSRIETGRPISKVDLALVEKVEKWMEANLAIGDLRCRIMHSGVELQMDKNNILLFGDGIEALRNAVPQLGDRSIMVALYSRGSAFVGDKAGIVNG